MAERITADFAKLIQTELDSICPEESMSRYMFKTDSSIHGAKFEEGQLMLDIKIGSTMHVLTLKPVGWERK